MYKIKVLSNKDYNKLKEDQGFRTQYVQLKQEYVHKGFFGTATVVKELQLSGILTEEGENEPTQPKQIAVKGEDVIQLIQSIFSN